MICNPPQNTVLTGTPDFIEVKGVAHSFGGSGLNRVDVSIDGGQTWTASDMYKPDDLLKKERFWKMWSWNLLSKKMPLKPEHKEVLAKGNRLKLELVSKAINTHFNVQPEWPDSYYNARGLSSTTSAVCPWSSTRTCCVANGTTKSFRGCGTTTTSQTRKKNGYELAP